MTTFEIEQLVVLVRKHRVEATSAAEAIVKLFDGETMLVDNNAEVVDLCDERGLPVDDHPALAEELRKAGILTDQTVIPSILSIEQVEGCETASRIGCVVRSCG